MSTRLICTEGRQIPSLSSTNHGARGGRCGPSLRASTRLNVVRGGGARTSFRRKTDLEGREKWKARIERRRSIARESANPPDSDAATYL